MQKLLIAITTIVLLTTTQGCSQNRQSSVDNNMLMKFIQTQVVQNRDIKVLGVDIVDKKKVDNFPDWEVLFVNMKLQYNNKEVTAPEKFFVNGDVITPVLFDLKRDVNLRDEINPTVSDDMYSKNHLMAGNADATHRVIVFTDPMCPYCQEVVPELLSDAKANPSVVAVYYYHLPLEQIHPASITLTKVMEYAHQNGRDDIIQKMYGLQIDPSITDEKVLLKAVQKQLGYNVTSAQINAPAIIQALKADKDVANKMMVSGTPTLYLDGKLDKMRDGYKQFLPKK